MRYHAILHNEHVGQNQARLAMFIGIKDQLILKGAHIYQYAYHHTIHDGDLVNNKNH